MIEKFALGLPAICKMAPSCHLMMVMRSVAALLLAAHGSTATNLADVFEMPSNESCAYPTNCPGKVLPRADKQTVRRREASI
jgi:hypothetical protein